MKSKTKILFITAFPPNRETAGQNYTRNLLNDLSNDFCVDVVYWDYPQHKVEVNSDIRYTCFQVDKINFNPVSYLYFPLFSRRFSFKALRKLKKMSKNYDILYFDFSQTFIYSYFIKHPFKIAMVHDVIAQKYGRNGLAKYLLNWIKWSENIFLKTFNFIFTFSSKDSKLLKADYNVSSSVVPFYIDEKINKIDLCHIDLQDYFVMYGAWNRPENIESIEWVLNNYRPEFPSLKIIGGGMSSTIKDKISQFPNIEVLGFIDDPYTIIASSKGLIAPLFHGAGVKVKAIESLSLGTPVIGTDVTFEGLPLTDKNILYDLSVINFSDTIEKLESLSIQQKIQIRESFFRNYIQNSFTTQIKKFI